MIDWQSITTAPRNKKILIACPWAEHPFVGFVEGKIAINIKGGILEGATHWAEFNLPGEGGEMEVGDSTKAKANWVPIEAFSPPPGTNVWCWRPNGVVQMCQLSNEGEWLYYPGRVPMKTPAMWTHAFAPEPPEVAYAFEACLESARKAGRGKL